MDDFHTAYQGILEYQSKIRPLNRTTEQHYAYIRDLVLAANVELVEFLQELPWKPWKPHYNQPCNLPLAQGELIDVIIFTLDLWFEVGGSYESFIKQLNQKCNLNLARIQSGFHAPIPKETK